MIKTGKKNEEMPDFDDMMNEVEQEIEGQDLEQSIIDRVPELKKLSADIDKATNAVIQGMLTLERAIDKCRQAERDLNGAVNTISTRSILSITISTMSSRTRQPNYRFQFRYLTPT